MRVNLYTALGALKIGMDLLLKEEGVQVDKLLGHGGLFKTKGVGQQILADAMNTPISVMETAGEGGRAGFLYGTESRRREPWRLPEQQSVCRSGRKRTGSRSGRSQRI